MRTYFFIAIALAGFLSACTKDDSIHWQNVEVTGNYINTPDPAGGFFTLTLPNGTQMPAPKKYKVSGTDNVIGLIDDTKSNLTVESVTLNPRTSAFDLVYHIVFYDLAGDEIHFEGTAQSYLDFTGIGWVHYTKGTGKFDGITGWENFTLVTDPATGVHTIKATGEAMYKSTTH